MRINRNDTIAGHPIKLARDMAKELERGFGGASMDVTHVTRWILSKGSERLKDYDPRYLKPTKADLKKGQAFLDEMIARGWLEQAMHTVAIKDKSKEFGYRHEEQPHKGYYTCSASGRSLALASLLKPIPRAKADKIVADLIERARAINANPDLIYWVKQLRAFGSYITKSVDVADIDIAFELKPRPVGEGEKWTNANKKRAKASGKQIVWPHTLYYGETEVQLLLKNRNQYLSLHSVSELEQIKADNRVIYQRSADQ